MCEKYTMQAINNQPSIIFLIQSATVLEHVDLLNIICSIAIGQKATAQKQAL